MEDTVFLFARWKHHRRMRQVARGMVQARRAGKGLYVAEWEAAVADPSALSSVLDQVTEWCRHTVGTCRRPYGIDHFDLAIARSVAGGLPPRSREFRDVRPLDLYQDGGLTERIGAFLTEAPVGADAGPTHTIKIAAALYSWG
ncbi:MAG: hypothetical protein HYX51_09445, partial [Chloroflexi bacterium]|nr:hypothetical protein [Chloroflexota bacterium]